VWVNPAASAWSARSALKSRHDRPPCGQRRTMNGWRRESI
jgi:hypothetical protein